jgi:hypothetical protein
MKTTIHVGLLVSSIATLAASGEALAEPATLMVVGEVAVREEAEVRTAARREIETAGWTLVESELSSEARSALVACLQRTSSEREGCLPGFLQKTPAERAVIVQVAHASEGKRSRLVSGWVFRRSGRTLAFEERPCRECRSEKLALTAGKLVGIVIRDARSAAAPSVLAIRSHPPGARITLDGKLIGATDVELRVYPGRHVVRLDKDGYPAATRELVIDDGEHATIEVTLSGADQPPVKRTPRPPKGKEKPGARKPAGNEAPLWPWALVAGGGACVLGGGVLLAVGTGDESFDEREQRGRELARPSPVALGLVGLGGVALGAGILFLVREGREEGKDKLAPVVSVERDAAWLGLRGIF